MCLTFLFFVSTYGNTGCTRLGELVLVGTLVVEVKCGSPGASTEGVPEVCFRIGCLCQAISAQISGNREVCDVHIIP